MAFFSVCSTLPIITSLSPNNGCSPSQTTTTVLSTTTAPEPKPKDAVLILNTHPDAQGLNTQPVITDVNGRNDANFFFRYGQVSKSALSNQKVKLKPLKAQTLKLKLAAL